MPVPTRLRRLIRRHRRPLAALLTGTAVLLALTSLRPAPPEAVTTTPTDPTHLRTGEVSVPVVLAGPALATVLDVGDVIDLVSVPDDGVPIVVAAAARVLELPTRTGGLGATSSALAMVAVREPAALPVAAANAGGGMTFIRRPQ